MRNALHEVGAVAVRRWKRETSDAALDVHPSTDDEWTKVTGGMAAERQE
ncbi:MAG TPA: hypothetical protein VGX76_06360 [Pirellulales bacterium]|nr:hypothetical protein [Pirellulales bacterium]